MNHNTLERIARQLCTDAGRDYDAKGCKRNYWRKKASRVVSGASTPLLTVQSTYDRVKDAMANIMGGRW